MSISSFLQVKPKRKDYKEYTVSIHYREERPGFPGHEQFSTVSWKKCDHFFKMVLKDGKGVWIPVDRIFEIEIEEVSE